MTDTEAVRAVFLFCMLSLPCTGCLPKNESNSSVKESDTKYPISCAEARNNAAVAQIHYKFYQRCWQESPGKEGGSDGGDIGPTTENQPDSASNNETGSSTAENSTTTSMDGFSLQSDTPCPTGAALTVPMSKAKTTLDGWIKYTENVCLASANANGTSNVDTCFDSNSFDWYSNNCHHAANKGVAAGPAGRTGIVRCSGPDASYYAGHQLNYVLGDCLVPGKSCQMVCLFEPQQGKDKSPCCYEQPNGSIDLTAGKGKLCAIQKCMGEENGKQDILPPGQLGKVDLPTDCRDNMKGSLKSGSLPTQADKSRCLTCCSNIIKRWASYLDDHGPKMQAQWESGKDKYSSECQNACNE